MNVIISSIIFLFSTLALAAADENKVLSTYSLEQLEGAALLLRTNVDLGAPKGDFCKISDADAKMLILPLHALLDEKMKQEVKNYRLQSKLRKYLAQCEKNCSCGVHVSAIELIAKPNDPQKKAMDEFNKKAAKMSAAKSYQCAKNTANWFCKSDLLLYLQKNKP